MTSENVVPMRLTGHQSPFPLTPEAHQELLGYLDEARAALVADPDGDETVRDLEVSIGDHLDALGEDPVGRNEMRTTLDEVGPVVSGSGETGPAGADPAVPTWSRILEGKWLSGVCLGVSAATQSSVAWVRAIYVLVTLVGGALLAAFSDFVMLIFFGLSVLLYLVLSLLLPPVASVDEYRRRSPLRGATAR